ncbi:uncharacterized protein V6R79_009368 [Siganus canaliculatus]
MYSRVNRRGHTEHYTDGHLKLDDLKVRARALKNQYLSNESIPDYPRPEFHASYLKHDTNRDGLRGIREDNGFKNPFESSLVWWSLVVGPEEIAAAERRLLETTFPDRTEEEVQKQQSFLENFASSPAFQKTSRLGSYRFTFSVEEVLKAYSDQFCAGDPPVIKVFETELFSQEVMYSVLVHSPDLLSNFPALTDDTNAVCSYKDGRFTWRSEAMCQTHSYKLVLRHDEKQMEAKQVELYRKFYVWDHVGVALHVDHQVLNFDADRLRKNLTFCCRPERGPILTRHHKFDDLPQAQRLVNELWPNYRALLEG